MNISNYIKDVKMNQILKMNKIGLNLKMAQKWLRFKIWAKVVKVTICIVPKKQHTKYQVSMPPNNRFTEVLHKYSMEYCLQWGTPQFLQSRKTVSCIFRIKPRWIETDYN